jgi:hypothetical protein
MPRHKDDPRIEEQGPLLLVPALSPGQEWTQLQAMLPAAEMARLEAIFEETGHPDGAGVCVVLSPCWRPEGASGSPDGGDLLGGASGSPDGGDLLGGYRARVCRIIFIVLGSVFGPLFNACFVCMQRAVPAERRSAPQAVATHVYCFLMMVSYTAFCNLSVASIWISYRQSSLSPAAVA